MKGPSNERAITSIDVSKYLDDLTKRRGGHWSFTITHDVTREKYARLSLVLEWREHVVLSKCRRHALKEWAHYPSNVHGSLAACMWDLCFKLDNRADENERLAQRAMPF